MTGTDPQDRPATGEATSLSDMVSKHREFMSLSWKDRSPAEISEKFFGTYGRLPLIVMRPTPDRLQCEILHRARWVDPQKEDLTDPGTFSYPRSPEKQIMGRANLPGIPVFYACGSAKSSFAEARTVTDDRLQLIRSEWKFGDHTEWPVVCMIKHGDIMERLPFRSAWEEALREYILKCDQIPQEQIIVLHDLIAELFLKENYEVTSWIAHQLMQEEAAADMLIYPSLQTGQQDLCHAFKAGPIDDGRVILDRVEQVDPMENNYRAIKSGVMKNGRIEWRPIAQKGAVKDCGTASTHCDDRASEKVIILPVSSGSGRPIERLS